MRPAHASTWLAAFISLAACAGLQAQPAPPPQDYVAAIGASPLRAPLTANFSPGTTFTIEGWFYLITANQPGWLMGKCLATMGTDPYVSFSLQINPDQTAGFIYSTGAPGSYRAINSPAAIPLRAWTHVAAVMEGTTTRLLINGTVVGTGSASGAPSAPTGVPFSVGIGFTANSDSAFNYQLFPGYARQLRLWSVARTAAQIAASLGESLPTDRTGLVAAWPLDDATGALSVHDISGAGRALTTPGLTAANTALLAAGPFYADTTTAVTDGSLTHVTLGALIDFDSDGQLDVVFEQTNYVPPNATPSRLRAFRNDHGKFTDVTDRVLGNVTLVHPRHYVVGDFNGDGRPDLLAVGHGYDYPPFPGEQSRLLIQSADGRLVDETAARLPSGIRFTHNVTAVDIDGDGDLDIYMCNVQGGALGPQLFINDGHGFFTLDNSRLPADIVDGSVGTFTGSLLVDVNHDGFPDLVLGALQGPAPHQGYGNQLLLNDRTGHFLRDSRFVLPPKLLDPSSTVVNIVSADFNGDGSPDLVLATATNLSIPLDDVHVSTGVQLLLNNGDGTFRDATVGSGLTFSPREQWVAWIHAVDFSGDGRPDLVVHMSSATAGNTQRLFLNLGTNPVQFRDVTEIYGFMPGAHAMLPGDLNGDGRIDFLVARPDSVTAALNLKPVETGRLVNLSVRTQAGTGDATLITGFALGGGTGSKQLLVRAIGPALSAFSVPGTLADPFVEVAPLGGPNVATNNDWGGTTALKNAFTSVGAFALSPDTSKDAALIFSPTPGAYTAKVTGANATTGVALVEVYDAGTGNTPRLINLSARTAVGTAADALITGFVVSGTLPKKLLLRAAGPSLAAFGVGGTLLDPVLSVRPLGSDTLVASNDDWAGTAALKAAFISVGAFSFVSDTSKDAALAVELPPGAYTATVTGKNNTTGVALVEVYELP